MRSSFSRVPQLKHLFSFAIMTGFLLAGYSNYSLFQQTRKLENLLRIIEAQKSKLREAQLIEAKDCSNVLVHGAAQLQKNYSVSYNRKNKFELPTEHIQSCRVNLSSVNWMKIPFIPRPTDFRNDTILSRVRYGGLYKPADCKARERVAIIVSYRDRTEHLEIFLNYMHAFLQQQKLQYGIYVVELALPTQFNRGLLNNIGFKTAQSVEYYDCFIFHDVDLLPKYIHNRYSCSDGPTHFAVRNMKYNFKLPYEKYVGGVFGVTPDAFEKANGFSNLYFGWGREDDDFRQRLYEAGYEIKRPEGRTGTYIALPHEFDTSNPSNPARFQLYKEALWRYKADGLSSMVYTRLALEFRELYTWIYAQANEVTIVMNYQRWKTKMLENGTQE